MVEEEEDKCLMTIVKPSGARYGLEFLCTFKSEEHVHLKPVGVMSHLDHD